MKATRKSAKSTTPKKSREAFSAEERAAIKERVKETKTAANKADGESDLLAKIAEMPERDRAMGKRLHALIKASAPALSPRTWYGMPAYAKDGKVVCFFQSGQKFKTRYATLGFSDDVADQFRSDEADRRRRGKDRSAREESGELKTGPKQTRPIRNREAPFTEPAPPSPASTSRPMSAPD